MSPEVKRAALVIAVMALITIYFLARDVLFTGSGGLGAVSADVTEMGFDVVVPAAIACLFVYLQGRRHRRQQADRSATRA